MHTVDLEWASSIWQEAPHNAFPDLISFKGHLFCAFREAKNHAGSNGKIRILRSEEGAEWETVALLEKEGIDLRDPRFAEMGDQLQLIMGGSVWDQDEKFVDRSPHVSFSSDGSHWTSLQDLKMPGEWIWRVTWNEGVGYGASYRTDKEWTLALLKSIDGIHYEKVTPLQVTDFPNETTLRFLPDGTLVALVRRKGNGWIGQAKAPFTEWTWNDCGYRLGGPNFVVLSDGTMWMGSRFFRGEKKEPYTALGPMTLTSVQPMVVLPSAGDTGYPGLALHKGALFVCYYSSHEAKTLIYIAKLK